MKPVILFFMIIATISIAKAQDTRYLNAMKNTVSQLDSAKTADDWQRINNSFERIADKANDKWLPKYYAAFCNVMLVYFVNNPLKTDEYCDKAQLLIDKADSLNPNNSEVFCVKSMVAAARIMVDPMTRGPKYGMQSKILLQKAKDMDSTNPRVYELMGEGFFYTPPAFGGGKDKALPLLLEAEDKFKTFKPASDIAPNWGQARNEDLISQCKQ